MPIPKNAKRVFKGEIHDVYQWRQKMFDGSYATFEAIKRPDTVIIIATAGNKLVMQKQRQPGTGWFISNPSGRMDVPGEKPKEAALRELLEETGMRPGRLFLWKKIKRNDKIQQTIHFFVAQDCHKVAAQNLDSGEKIKLFYLSLDDYLKLADNPSAHLQESVVDMLRARADKNYKQYLQRTFFGTVSKK
ncbi:MAG TPA: NUDIX hydrolase [Patescibacteria group bacterium]|nr:NUDIX hydrolase [Patescibacteria group bacterium]